MIYHTTMHGILLLWVGTPNCYLELLNKLQKWICRTAGPSLAASLEPLAHCRNVAYISLFYSFLIVLFILFYRYYLCRCSAELAQLAPLSYS